MLETKDIIILSYSVGFISGAFCAAFYWYLMRHNAPEARHAPLAAADGKPRHDGNEKRIIALVIGLVLVSVVIVFDRFKGPLFPDVFYCLNDGGAPITRICTGRAPVGSPDVRDRPGNFDPQTMAP
jgi:hypothetical protein